MLLKEFPDINMVRGLKNDAARGVAEWRNVVLNFECREASRLNLESPYSLFVNKKGHSYCSVNRNHYRVETDTFLFSQPGDVYGLTIDNLHKTELCNIHINRKFFDSAVNALASGSKQLLDNPFDTRNAEIPMFTQLYRKDDRFNLLADKLTQQETYDTKSFEAVLAELIEHIMMQNTGIRNSIERLPFVKASVRVEIYHRLSAAKDYIHSNYQSQIELDEVCREIGMSKFHFLRVFKACYGVSPYQYLSDVRMEKARAMLQHSNASIAEIGAGLGYEYPNSFIKAFRKTYRIAPLQYRNSKISNFG